MPEWFHIYLNELIVGEFKWTLLGMLLTLWALFFGKMFELISKKWWVGAIISSVLLVLFIWYGHELIDPLFHKLANWWTTPLAEPMKLEYR